jgi:uncharacterized protein (TIGR02679 family)
VSENEPSDSEKAATERLARPGLEPLVAELARRFASGAGDPARVQLANLSGPQRAALADLFADAHLPKLPAVVRIDRLCARLGLDSPAALRRCIEALTGPLGDLAAERRERQRSREELWAWFDERSAGLALVGLGPLRDWPAAVRREGIRGEITDYREELSRVFHVLDQLPSEGVSLATLAGTAVNNPHALDRGTRLGRLVVSAIADAAGLARPRTAETIRETWQLVGIETDPLSSTVLALGVRPPEGHPLAASLGQLADASEPAVFTLSQLLRWPFPPLDASELVYVVENPSLLADAARRRWSGPPIVCSSGRPSLAVVLAIRQLGQTGATLLQHADFDAAGIGICSWLAAHAGTTPWKMSSSEYRAAVLTGGDRESITEPVPDTPWDPGLADALRDVRRAVFEEEVAEDLLRAMVAQLGG